MITDSTIVFDEEVKGWTSFFSFDPEYMTGLNGKFFSFKNGDLWLHNSKNVPRNNFYGQQFTSKVSVVLNDKPSTEKMFKNIMLESNKTWDIKLSSNLSEGEIYKDEFHKRKSRWFAYTRRNENEEDLTSFAANGIGNPSEITGNDLQFKKIGELISVGDRLIQQQSGTSVEIGTISNIDRDSGIVSLTGFENTPNVGDFCYATKDARTEGGELRGYYMRLDMENDATDFSELYAVTSNAAESYV